MRQTSTPGTEAIASMFATASVVSIIGQMSTFSLKKSMYSR